MHTETCNLLRHKYFNPMEYNEKKTKTKQDRYIQFQLDSLSVKSHFAVLAYPESGKVGSGDGHSKALVLGRSKTLYFVFLQRVI